MRREKAEACAREIVYREKGCVLDLPARAMRASEVDL